MELTGHHIVPPNTRHKRRPIVRRGCRNGLVSWIDIKGMHKVPVRPVGNPFEQGTGPLVRHIIPTHMRHLQPLIGSKSSDLAGDHAEPLVSPKFLTFLKQQLEPQADSQKWFSRLNRRTNRSHQPIAFNIVHSIPKGPETRQTALLPIPDHTPIK